ncbi:MAG: DedA family protein [Campylobacteraceae bacterium]
MQDTLYTLLITYGYVILFVWCMIQADSALILSGILISKGDLDFSTSVIVGAIGAFIGNEIYFYLGRFNKNFVYKKLKNYQQAISKTRLLFDKYGSLIIIAQRYLYGLRTIIPITAGLSSYNAKTFLILNFISAFIWAFVFIFPSYYFGEDILNLLSLAKIHWKMSLTVVTLILLFVWFFYLHKKRKSAKNR